ncbi:hypothetical protein F3G47_28940 [Klebsiella pneumoniae]|nr:hypothetical protein F3G47_28940 [Klebsiella pneumoniae]
MTYLKSHHLTFDYSLFPPDLTLITALTLITGDLIIVCFVVLLLMPFPGVPLAGRAVVNGASEAVSALAGFHP